MISKSTSLASGLLRVCTPRIALRPTTSGGETKICRSKRPGRSSAGSSLSSRLDAAITTRSPLVAKPSISTSSWLSVCSRSELLSEPRWAPTASISSMKTIAGALLARLGEQAPDAGRAEAGEHLDEAGGRLREELRAGLVGHGLGQQRLAGAGRAVQQDALRAPSRRACAKRSGSRQEVDDLAQLGLGLVDAGDLVPLDRGVGVRLDLLRLRLGHQLHRPPQEEDDQGHEEQRRPGQDVLETWSHHESPSSTVCVTAGVGTGGRARVGAIKRPP